MAESKEKVAVKRGPGRPRKTPLKAPPNVRGIIREPDNAGNIVEWEYNHPATFKKFASYWKSLNAEKVALVFTPDRLLIYTHDYKENSYVRHRVMGDKMVSYYCPTVLSMVLLQKDIDLILQKLDKECDLIAMFITHRNRDKVLNFIISTEWGIPEQFDIEVVIEPTFVRLFDGIFDESVPYPIQLNLPSKYFKKAISDMKSFEDKWAIEYHNIPGMPLRFPYKSANGHVRGRDVPPKKMILVNDILPGNHFSVSMYANILKPTSQAMLADDIILHAADDGRSTWLIAQVDGKAIPTDILVKVIDLRKPTTAITGTPVPYPHE